MMPKSTHIGSLPFTSLQDAIDFNKGFDIPVISSLGNLNPKEFILEQIVSGINNCSIVDFKIKRTPNTQLEFLKNYNIEFEILDEFVKTFGGMEVKWQIVGPITLMQSFEVKLSHSEKKQFIEWYLNLILIFHHRIKGKFTKVHLFLDEPLYDSSEEIFLKECVDTLKQNNISLGIHCCQKLNESKVESLIKLKIAFLSLDCSLYQTNFLKNLKLKGTCLVAGIYHTDTGSLCENGEEVKQISDYISPTCGLNFTNIKVCAALKKQLCSL